MQSSGITDTHGQSHQQCNSQTGCGIEFYVDGKRWELEGGELVLCPEAAQSTQIHKVKGIPAQIISKLNQKYCGKVYIDGGELADVPEKNFDIEKIAVVDELKPHSLVINKKNSLSNTCFELEGTPRQIASYLNEYNNHGDSFRWDERTANVINILENGGEIITTIDSSDPGRYMKLYLMSKKAGKGTEISETKSPSAHQSISPSTYQPSNTIHELFKGTMTAEKFRQMHGIEKKEEQPNELSRQLHEKGIIKDPANRVKNKFKELKNILMEKPFSMLRENDETKSILNQETDLKGDKKQNHQMSLTEFLKKERKSKGKEAVDNLSELFKEHYQNAIEYAIKKGWYGEDITADRMTANDAKSIIESAGLTVPSDILLLTGKNLHSGGEVAPAIEIENPARWQKKKEHIQELANNIQRLRLNVSNDLKSNDQKIFLTALVVAIMDKTGERVGNEDSASNGHFGITGLQKEHISFAGNKVILNYTGKSGVDHEKEFTDIKLLKYLKKAIRKSPGKFVFVTTDDFKIKADTVNRYLTDFNVTAKDIRGYSANKWIINKLNCLEEISSEENKRKREFSAIVKKVAQKIGHGPGTLKKHYLIPELAEQFILHGKIIDIKNLGYTMDKGGEIPGINSKLQTLYSILKSEYQLQLSKGIAVEQEHKETLEKVASGKISIPEAIKETANEHIKEPQYYSKLEQIEKGELSDNEKNFVKKLLEDILAGVQYNNPRLEKAANEFNITDRRIIKELAELSIVIYARKIANS